MSPPSVPSCSGDAGQSKPSRSLLAPPLLPVTLHNLRPFKLDTGQRPLSGFTDEDTGAQMGDMVCPAPGSTLELWGQLPRDRNAWLLPSPMLLFFLF